MNAPRKVEPAFDEGVAFEALLNRHKDRFMNWFLCRLIQNPAMCRAIGALVRQAEQDKGLSE